jgi:hypothetical protein
MMLINAINLDRKSGGSPPLPFVPDPTVVFSRIGTDRHEGFLLRVLTLSNSPTLIPKSKSTIVRESPNTNPLIRSQIVSLSRFDAKRRIPGIHIPCWADHSERAR